jgi:hypothetical protein
MAVSHCLGGCGSPIPREAPDDAPWRGINGYRPWLTAPGGPRTRPLNAVDNP